MASQLGLYRMRDGKTPLAARYFNPVWESIDVRLVALEGGLAQAAAGLAEVREMGVEGIQAVVLPLIEQAQLLVTEIEDRLGALELPAAADDLLAYTSRADSTAIAYDGEGRVSTITEDYGDATKDVTLTYDGNGRVSVIRTDWDGVRRTETIGYDHNGNLITITATESPL